jgi:hypothetical protein
MDINRLTEKTQEALYTAHLPAALLVLGVSTILKPFI